MTYTDVYTDFYGEVIGTGQGEQITEILYDGVIFYQGRGGLSSDVPVPFSISIEGEPFEIDLRLFEWKQPNMLRQAVDLSSRPGEQSYDVDGVWKRIMSDWSLGAGQTWQDRDRSEERRFSSSLGIDPWTPYQLSLLPACELGLSGLNTDIIRCLSLGGYLYVVASDTGTNACTVIRFSTPQGATLLDIGLEAVGSLFVTLNDLTTDGYYLYLATNGGIYRHAPTSITTDLMGADAATFVADHIGAANGWLLVSAFTELSTVADDGTITSLWDHPNPNYAWSAIVGTPANIYAAGHAGDQSSIYRIGLDPDTGGLATPIWAGAPARGEQILSLAYYGSVLLIGTDVGLHVADIGNDGGLSIGPLIRTDAPANAIATDAEFAWFTWPNYDSTHTGVGRAKLSEFTDTLRPAYASDIMLDGVGNVTDVCRHDGRTYFVIPNVGFAREAAGDTLAATGTLQGGRVVFGTGESKAFLGADVLCAPLDGMVRLAVVDDVEDTRTLGVLQDQGATGRNAPFGTGQPGLSSYFDPVVTLSRSNDDPSTGPVVHQITLRGLPVPSQIERWVLPIIAKDDLNLGPDGYAEISQNVLDIQEFFSELQRDGRPVRFQHGRRTRTVVVREVEYPKGSVERWSHDRTGLQGILYVTIQSVSSEG